MDFTVIQFFWILAGVAIILLSIVRECAPYFPQFVNDLFLYGKVKGTQKRSTLVRWIELPKSWFIHFYLVGTLVNGMMVYHAGNAYIFGVPPPEIIVRILDTLAPNQPVVVNGMNALLLISMMFIQNLRRLYECIFISVYSKSTMNLLHYLLGILLYSTFWVAVLSQAPDLNKYRVVNVNDEFFHWQNLVAIALFTWASFHHHDTHCLLALLRLDRAGQVTSDGHAIPLGGWFDSLSCPHYFFEIVIYCIFQWVAGLHHYNVWAITFFVVGNQMVAGHLTHKWYCKTFGEQYPTDRKAVIPFIL